MTKSETGKAGSARVVHHIRGRVRLKIENGRGDQALLESIQRTLSPLRGVKQVDVNSQTGSVLVHYNPSEHADFHAELDRTAADAGLFNLQPPQVTEAQVWAERIEREAEFLSAHSDLAKTVVDFVKSVNVGVKKATHNAVDLNVLLPLGLAIYSVLELEAEMSTPMWVTLGIFSFNSFVSLHVQPPQVDVHTGGDVIVNPPAGAGCSEQEASPAVSRTSRHKAPAST